MAIQGFDYKTFAQSLTEQAFQLVPPEFSEDEKQYVANTLLNFATIAGEALYNDTESNFNIDQAVMITQIIAEWSFHKSVDLIRSGLPQQFWDSIMQKIAFTIFEVAKQAFKQSIPQDQTLQLIEHHVKKTYNEAVEELKTKNLIDDGLMNTALNQSNIDAMMQQQMEEEQMTQQAGPASIPSDVNNMPQQQMPQGSNVPAVAASSTPKPLKLATLAMLFQKMKQDKVQTMLDKFESDDAHSVIKFMDMDDLNEKMDPVAALRCLQEIRTKLPAQKDINLVKVIQRIQGFSEYADKNRLEQILQFERMKVKRFVFTALEGEQYEMAPRVANIIATHIEESL